VKRNPPVNGVYTVSTGIRTVVTAAEVFGGVITRFYNVSFLPQAGFGNLIIRRDIRIRKISFGSQHTTALATPTGPRITFQRFLGQSVDPGLGGGVQSVLKHDFIYPDPMGRMLNGSAFDASQIQDAAFAHAPIVGALTAVGAYVPVVFDVLNTGDSDDDNFILLRPSDGIAIFQSSAGTVADTRVWWANICWDETPEVPQVRSGDKV
jgi:hypothetical protein